MYKLTNKIYEAIQQCVNTGDCRRVNIDNNSFVMAEWDTLDQDNNYDVVTVYICQNGNIISFVIEETKTL